MQQMIYHFDFPFEADGCVFVYTQQPPSCFSCNPYNNATSPPQLQLNLSCGARRTDDKMNQYTFDLRWFSNYSSEALHHVSHVRTPPFSNISLLVTSPGQYWCRVLDYTDGPELLLGSSNIAEVLSWEQYSSLPMCNGIQSVMESKCADPSPSPFTSSTSNDLTCISSQTNGVPSVSVSTVLDGGSTGFLTVPDGGSTGVLTVELIGVIVLMLILLLLLIMGISIALFIRKKRNSEPRSKASKYDTVFIVSKKLINRYMYLIVSGVTEKQEKSKHSKKM